MKFKAFFLNLILAHSALAGNCHLPLKVAIIDTGLDLTDIRFAGHICEKGHFNFVDNSDKVDDLHGHGTHVAGLIEKYAGEGNYCFLVYKYYSDANPGKVNLSNEILAIKKATSEGATIVNFSGGGPEFDEEEYLAIKRNPRITFIVAAGNENENIDYPTGYFYPASYHLQNVIVIGNINKDAKKADSSNYGKRVNATEMGVDVKSFLPGGKEGSMTGTSQATAIHTGKIISEKLIRCDIGL